MNSIRKTFLPFYLFAFLFFFASCDETSNTFRLEGKFKNINQGEFYLYDLDQGRKDTISLREGKFTYETSMRDTTVLVLMFPNYSELPIIATPGAKVKMKGDVSHLKETEITGTDDNELMTAFRLQTGELMPPEVKQKAEEFIHEHPESPVCLYLLRRYFILAMDADYKQIAELGRKMLDANTTNVRLVQLNQRLEDVVGTWPAADVPVAVRCSDYMFRPHQLWTITPVTEAGGYLSNPYFKITIAGTDRALTATADKELATVAYQGGNEQLWRIEQLTDGTYRIMPKQIPGEDGINTRYCLYSAADSTPTLAVYDFSSDNSKWNLRNH